MEFTHSLKRSRQCMPDLLDLSEYYNCQFENELLEGEPFSLASFPQGLRIFSKIAFDARGIIRLAKAGDAEVSSYGTPPNVVSIPVYRTCRTLHFLQGMAGVAADGTRIGQYVLHYSDGQMRTIPIEIGRNLGGSHAPPDMERVPDADIAWTGSDSQAPDSQSVVYAYTVNNPLTTVELDTIGIVVHPGAWALCVIAITIEPLETIYLNFGEGFSPTNTIMPRNAWAHENLVDLTPYYTASLDDDWHNHEGHDLQNVPKGLQVLGGVTFDVRGLIQLAAGNISLRRTGIVYKESVKGIQIHRKASVVHFLQACGWSTQVDVEVESYTVNYTDGTQVVVPLVYGRNIADWWESPENKFSPDTTVVWKGYNSFCHNLGVKVQLLKFSWINPHSEKFIESVDFTSYLETAGPFLVALSLETERASH